MVDWAQDLHHLVQVTADHFAELFRDPDPMEEYFTSFQPLRKDDKGEFDGDHRVSANGATALEGTAKMNIQRRRANITFVFVGNDLFPTIFRLFRKSSVIAAAERTSYL